MPETIPLSPGRWRQRDGGEAKIYARSPREDVESPWIGLNAVGHPEVWRDNGRYFATCEFGLDLLERIGDLDDGLAPSGV